MNYPSSFNSTYDFPSATDLEFPKEWGPAMDDQMLFSITEGKDTYGVTTSSTDADWQTDKMMSHHPLEDDYNDDQDMQDDFHMQPLEERFTNALYFDEVDSGFLDPLLSVETTDYDNDYGDDSSIGLPLEERYKATLEKLQASMKRSQETRNCLTMKTATTESYERVGNVKDLLSSIATSSGQVQKYVTSIQRPI